MIDYTGIKCPVCEVPFKADDDIVVCPVCGAPHHRACYEQEGKCFFESEHASGKEWTLPKPPKAPNTDAEIKDRECPVCGVLNAHSALFCNRCGASLVGNPEMHSNHLNNSVRTDQMPGSELPKFNGFGGLGQQFIYDPMGGVDPTETADGNITFGEISKYVKQNTAYYLPVFSSIKRFKRSRFNFCAFLFSGGWMLYRKQYKFGIIISAIMLTLFAAYSFVSYFVTTPVILDIYSKIGIDPSAYSATMSLTAEQYAALQAVLLSNPNSMLLVVLPLIFIAVMLAVMIFCGVRGNKMYFNDCVRKIKKMKASGNSSDTAATIETSGGINIYAALAVFVIYSFILYLPSILALLNLS